MYTIPVNIYVEMFMNTHSYTCEHISMYIHKLHMCTYTNAYKTCKVYTCIYANMYMNINLCIYVHVHICKYVFT